MYLRKETRQIQSALAAYCRSGELKPIEGARTDRLHHYRRLVFNVIDSTLEGAYPLTRQILSDDEWDQLVNDFFRNHDASSERIWKMPFEFYEYCLANNYSEKLSRPYLDDLLYFEWIEIHIHTMPDQTIPGHGKLGDLLTDELVINPEYMLLHLEYPVHKLPASRLEASRGNYYVLVFREQQNLTVRFMELSAGFALLFNKLSRDGIIAKEALFDTGRQLNITDEQILIQLGLPFLNDLYTQGIILGFK
ncbi:MAG: DUF2063 domain-containing protein [Calditrichaceae bacterium]